MHHLFQWYIFFHILIVGVIGQNKTKIKDEDRPYEFSFKIGSEQHRYEKRDVNGIIQGEFGFITADGVYHVTVYATDENGNFKILSMKNIKVSEPLDQIDRKSQSKQSGYEQITSPHSQSSVSLFGNYQTSEYQQTTPLSNKYASTFYQPSSVTSRYQPTINYVTPSPFHQSSSVTSKYQPTINYVTPSTFHQPLSVTTKYQPSINYVTPSSFHQSSSVTSKYQPTINYVTPSSFHQSSSVTSKYQPTTNYVTPRPFSGFTTGSTIRQGCGGCGIITTPLAPLQTFSNTLTSKPSNINLLSGHVTNKPANINVFSGTVTNQPVTNIFSNTVTSKSQNTNLFSHTITNKPNTVSLISDTNRNNTNVFSIREKPNLLFNSVTNNPPTVNFRLSTVTNKPFNTNLHSGTVTSNPNFQSNTITNKPFNTNLLSGTVTNTVPNVNILINTITEKPFNFVSGTVTNVNPFSNTVVNTSPNPTKTIKPFDTSLLPNSLTNSPPKVNVFVNTITEKPFSTFSRTITNVNPFSNTVENISPNPTIANKHFNTNLLSNSVTNSPPTNLVVTITEKTFNSLSGSVTNVNPFSNTIPNSSPNPTIKPFNTSLLSNSLTNTPPNVNLFVNTITEKPFKTYSGTVINVNPFSNTVENTSPNPTLTNKYFNTNLLSNSITNGPQTNLVVNTITEKPVSIFAGTVPSINPFSNTANISPNPTTSNKPISTNRLSSPVTNTLLNVNSVSNTVTNNPHVTNPFLSADIDVRFEPNSFGVNDRTTSTLNPQIFKQQSSISVNNEITTPKPITTGTRQAKVLHQNTPRVTSFYENTLSPQNHPSLTNTPNYSLDKSSKAVIENGVIKVPGNDPIPIKDKYPNMVEGLPKGITKQDISELLYKFNYTVGFHGHYEKGWTNGTKIGGYFVNGRDGYSRVVTYVADEFGYRPKFSLIRLGLDSISTPKEETEKSFGLQNFEFVWYPLK